MSLLLSQPSLCVRKPVLVRSSPFICNASSTSSPQNIPFATLCSDPCRPSLGTFTPLKGKAPLDILPGTGLMGSSNGWLATLKEDGIIQLQDLFVHQPKCLTLPPIKTLPLCQTQIVTNVAMSSSSFGGVNLAVKFLGPQLSFCRLRLDFESWTNIRIPNPSFFSSSVMYSKKDKMFHMVGSGGHLIGSWDRFGDASEFQKLQFQNIPELSKGKRELLDTCCTSEHLVESESTGERFMVKWYKKTVAEGDDGVNKMETIALMVFKLDDEENAVYTKNIGDLAILLTKSEAFCVPASTVPDMRCNSVKIMDVDETTTVDLAAQKWN